MMLKYDYHTLLIFTFIKIPHLLRFVSYERRQRDNIQISLKKFAICNRITVCTTKFVSAQEFIFNCLRV